MIFNKNRKCSNKKNNETPDPTASVAIKKADRDNYLPEKDFKNFITETEAFIFWILNKQYGFGSKKFLRFLEDFDSVFRAYSAEIITYKECDHDIFRNELKNLGYHFSDDNKIVVDHKQKMNNAKYKKDIIEK